LTGKKLYAIIEPELGGPSETLDRYKEPVKNRYWREAISKIKMEVK